MKKITGIIFALLTIFVIAKFKNAFAYDDPMLYVFYGITIALAFVSLLCFIPKGANEISLKYEKHTKRAIILAIFTILLIVLTVFAGVYLFGDRKYYFISLLIIFEIMIPFAFDFEKRKENAREIVMISVLCALAVAGRYVLAMVPQFKPTLAIIIISGVCLGGEKGFLVGAVSAFVSNFFFGQGAWTPWQMLCMGIVGFVAGLVFKKIKVNKINLSLYGFFSAIILYGGIINFGSVLMYQPYPTLEAVTLSYAMGLPVDIIHGFSTFFFLWFISIPMIEKIERVKTKYGI